jgi:hypothetical protein
LAVGSLVGTFLGYYGYQMMNIWIKENIVVRKS